MSEKQRPGVLRLMEQGERRNGSPVRDILQENALASSSDNDTSGALSLPGVISETALKLPEGLSIEAWQSTGLTLSRIHKAWKWWFGDWLNYGERAYGEMYSQAMEVSGLPYHSVAQIKYVASAVPADRRHEGLTWSHHEAIAGLQAEDQSFLLEQAEEGEWNRERLRKAVELVQNKLPPAVTEQPELCQCHCHLTGYCADCGKPSGA